MFSRLFSASSGKSTKKWNKEVSLTVNDKHNPEGYSLKVPKRCLIEHSGYFRDNLDELKKTKKINLDEVTITGLQKIVEYMRKCTATFLNHTEVLETLKAAHKYQIEKMVDICCNNLLTVLDPSNVCDIYDAAFTLQLSQLEFSCLKLIDQCADDVLGSRGFLTLSRASVREIIKRSSLNVSSETVVFRAVLGWGLNDSLHRHIDASDVDKFIPVVKFLFNNVRFGVMSVEEMADPEVSKYQALVSSSESWSKIRSVSDVSQGSSTSNDIQPDKKPRQHVLQYSHPIGAYESNLYKVKCGEVFLLKTEILKGKVFFTGLKLGFQQFSATTKSDACLYVLLTVTNTSTSEQKTTRGTFLSTTDEASLTLSVPLKASELECVEFSLSVKRAENICPLAVNQDIQIAMPDSKAVAIKVMPLASSETEETVRCIFKELEYFF